MLNSFVQKKVKEASFCLLENLRLKLGAGQLVSMVVVRVVELVVYIDPPDEAGSTLPGK